MPYESDAGNGDGRVYGFSGRDDRLYLFAYGTNMHPGQVGERCHRPTCLGPAVLEDHDLDFFGWNETWDGGLTSVFPAAGRRVWGVVYELSYGDAQRLDVWQDARLDGAGSYFHYPVKVTLRDGGELALLLYKKEQQGDPAQPSREMLDFIIEGARLRRLPEDYIAGLAARPAKPAGYPVPQRGGSLLNLRVVTNCSECDL